MNTLNNEHATMPANIFSVRIKPIAWICPFLFMLLLAGCDEFGAPSTRHAPAETISGRWSWVSSLDVRTQSLHTPTSEGFEAELTLKSATTHTGTFTYARSNATPVSGSFIVASEDAPGNDFIVLDKAIDFLTRNAWVAAGTDSLQLGGIMEMGYNSRYVRVN